MLFNSFTFVYFFLLIYLLYLVLPRNRQNLLLLFGSFFFYAWWDARFLALLVFSIVADYLFALAIEGTSKAIERRVLLASSISLSLIILGFFKYFSFFTSELVGALRGFGVTGPLQSLDVILPLGISFYTFQTISYVVDVYKRRQKASRDFTAFALYVAFFPQLIAGPIERARRLLGQISLARHVTPTAVNEAFWYLLYGYFLKTVVADNLVPLVSGVRGNILSIEPGELLPTFYASSFMLYADFAGYSYIAMGLAKLMGFDLVHNFKLPFFSRNPADFWRRWHVSLSDWFRDYVFAPLTRLRRRPRAFYVAFCAMLTMILCGLWHGASWNFVAFGFYHGLLLVSYYACRGYLRRYGMDSRMLANLVKLASVVIMFHLLTAGAILFVVKKPADFLLFMQRLVAEGLPVTWGAGVATLLAFGLPLLVIDALQEIKKDLRLIPAQPLLLRWPIYTGLLLLIVLCGATGTHEFVYFQF